MMDNKNKWMSLGSLVCIILSNVEVALADYKIGVGRADCTGPSAEITFMGYAQLGQRGCGIHLRQYSRAFIFQDTVNIAAFVTIDACMMNYGVKKAVLAALKDKAYGDQFTDDNLILSGTHTHGAPGGFLMDVMLDIPNLGFVQETFNSLVTGIVKSIDNAYNSIADAKVFVNSGEIEDANINRSPASYLYNSAEERAKYTANTDKTIVQLKIVRTNDNKTIGAINWFAVHPTSMNNTNCLVTSDNVGYASILLETKMDPDNLPGKSDFVGAFASSNLGDVSPNTKGPICIDTGLACEMTKSTCNGTTQNCIASGPGKDMMDSTKIIAGKIFEKGYELVSDASATEVTGAIKYIHQFVDMPKQTVVIKDASGNNKTVKGCLPGMGYSFAAGTTDGPGEFDFTQATDTPNIFWNTIRDFIFPPTPEDVECHAPKPILIMSGQIRLPYEWQPEVVVTQLVMIGNIILTAVPGEFTTMSGRRMRDNIKDAVIAAGPANAQAIITGLSNVYTNYIATPEEYQGTKVEAGPKPYDFPEADKLFTLNTPVVFDTSGWFYSFGDCIQQPPSSAKIGDSVSAKFISGHPRNNPMLESSFLYVEIKDGDNWIPVATDSSWETIFKWTRTNAIKGSSEIEITWDIVKDMFEAGTYRIRHCGYYKYIFGGTYPYEG